MGVRFQSVRDRVIHVGGGFAEMRHFSAGPGAVPWYLAGGVSCCVAAYKATGAASLAASYINLANPGTYDLSGGVDPTWDAVNGWTFTGAQYKSTGITPGVGAAQTWSLLVQYSDAVEGYAMGYWTGAGAQYFGMSPRRTGLSTYWNGTTSAKGASYSTDGIQVLAGANGYISGVLDATCTLASIPGAAIAIGALTTAVPFTGKIQAAAVYSCVLSLDQILAIAAALDPTLPLPTFGAPDTPASGEFTLVFFSDPHTGSTVTASEIDTNLQYVADNAAALNIQAVLCGGDMTNDIDSKPVQQAAFMSALGNIASVPHLVAIGNHDYSDDGITNRLATAFNDAANLPQAYYTGMGWWSGGFYEAGHAENAYMLLTIEGADYIFIALEFFPRQAVLNWASALLTTYAARTAIIITHSYEYLDDTPVSAGDPYGPASYPLICDADYHDGDGMWSDLLNVHDNVILIYSGHIVAGPTDAITGYHSANSAGGQAVHQMLCNYQQAVGWSRTVMRFMLVNPTNQTIAVKTFAPKYGLVIDDADNEFVMSY